MWSAIAKQVLRWFKAPMKKRAMTPKDGSISSKKKSKNWENCWRSLNDSVQ